MNTSSLSLSFYLILVFLQGAIYGAMASRNRNTNSKRVPARLKLLRRIYSNFDNSGDLLKLTDTRHAKPYYSQNEDHKAKLYLTSSDHHVPDLQCAQEQDMIPCPTPSLKHGYYCIHPEDLCDRKFHCPQGEDENLIACMFYKSMQITKDELHDRIGHHHPD